MKSKNRWKDLTLQQKLTALFVLTAVIILAVNLYMYALLNAMTGRVEQVYDSNLQLNDLTEHLNQVHSNVKEYLMTKSSDSMENYYRSEQDYREQLTGLNSTITADERLITEKNIASLSETYLELTEEIIQAKRGRNVERYSKLYEKADKLHGQILAFIYSLNNDQFKENSVNYRALVNSLRYTEFLSMAILLIVMLGNISLIMFSTKSITEPLHKLADAAGRVADGNFEIDKLPVESMDEVGVVTKTFNQMVESIRNYIEQLRLTMERENQMKERELMMQSHLKDAQLRYLQAQINPHFLFNTLNAGAQLAMMERARRTEELLENLAEFFRYNVRKNCQDATLEEELRLVDNYIYILNVRFSGEIHYEKDVDKSLLQTRIPSMSLQPLVENAVNHGIRGIDREGRIEVSVQKLNDAICISVWDNGIGMEPEQIRQVLAGHAGESDQKVGSNGVGVKNVMERLELYYHGKAKFEIFSEGKDMGTEMLITVFKEAVTACWEEREDVSDHAGG